MPDGSSAGSLTSSSLPRSMRKILMWNCRIMKSIHMWLTQGSERKYLQFQLVMNVGTMVRHASLVTIKLHPYSLTLTINEMKRLYKKVFKSKKPSLGSHGHGPATSTLTLITNTTDLMPSIHASDVTASHGAQVTAGVSVSVQLRPSHV